MRAELNPVRPMKMRMYFLFPVIVIGWLIPVMGFAQSGPMEAFTEKWNRVLDSIAKDFHLVRVEVVESSGLGRDFKGLQLGVALGAEGRFYVEGQWQKHFLRASRNGPDLWVHAPEKEFGVIGRNGIPLYSADPEFMVPVNLDELFRFPMTLAQLRGLPLLFHVAEEPIEGQEASHYLLRPSEVANKLFGESDLQVNWRFSGGGVEESELTLQSKGRKLVLHFSLESEPVDEGIFFIEEESKDQFTAVALYHLARGYRVISSQLMGKSRPRAFWPEGVVKQHGKGRLTLRNGTALLYLEGTPEEMGEQHGALLKERIEFLYDQLLYGVGVGSSFIRGSWFFGDIEEAQSRLLPHMNPAYLREMDAMADAAGMHREKVRMGNFFPELFHCSGFAVFGEATEDGMLYHGRILDYIRGMGLEESAIVIVMNPDEGHSWVNIGYAGFTGTVTAMNERGVAIGEMGGDGWGDWDGKPMAQLMREVMETASSVEEGIAIFERGPRTCEYYYVISQANPNHAVGLVATPDKLEKVLPGELHPLLQKPLTDTVMLSRGDRYLCLTDRVKEEYGQIDMEKAWWLMSRPVAMRSNIQSALFRPETLDFWVANATPDKVASEREATPFNLKQLLEEFADKGEEQ